MIKCPPAIQREMDRLQLTLLDEHWRTRQASYRFCCQHGHEFAWKADVLLSLSECPHCRNVRKLRRIQDKAAQDGSQCLDEWRGSTALYRFRCLSDPSHEWLRSFTVALRTSSCPHCKPRGPKLMTNGLQRLQEYAKSRGGECISPIYLGGERKHSFRCAQGHIWDARPSSMLGNSTWCQQCQSDQQRLGIDKVRASAVVRGGQFLSTAYLNDRTLYDWACQKGHTWRACYGSIRSGSWCPHCANDQRRLDLQTLQRAAEAKGGTCLSDAYVSTTSDYQWQCAKGHIWKAQYAAIRNGHWCQRCHIESRKLTLEHMQQTARERGGLCLSLHYEGARAHYQWQCARGHTWRAIYIHVRSGTWCPTCHHMSLTKPGSAAWRRYQTHQPQD